ncbi:hypothetical protein GGR56DRAFT_627628 [Xylariaceae sp. FL0804]|nr:hypothetical protein GGR56DRAFT_627628 [Xylariaceae sp. FL0804]
MEKLQCNIQNMSFNIWGWDDLNWIMHDIGDVDLQGSDSSLSFAAILDYMYGARGEDPLITFGLKTSLCNCPDRGRPLGRPFTNLRRIVLDLGRDVISQAFGLETPGEWTAENQEVMARLPRDEFGFYSIDSSQANFGCFTEVWTKAPESSPVGPVHKIAFSEWIQAMVAFTRRQLSNWTADLDIYCAVYFREHSMPIPTLSEEWAVLW